MNWKFVLVISINIFFIKSILINCKNAGVSIAKCNITSLINMTCTLQNGRINAVPGEKVNCTCHVNCRDFIMTCGPDEQWVWDRHFFRNTCRVNNHTQDYGPLKSTFLYTKFNFSCAEGYKLEGNSTDIKCNPKVGKIIGEKPMCLKLQPLNSGINKIDSPINLSLFAIIGILLLIFIALTVYFIRMKCQRTENSTRAEIQEPKVHYATVKKEVNNDLEYDYPVFPINTNDSNGMTENYAYVTI